MSARALDTQNAPRVDAERAGDERIALGKQAFKHALLDNLLYVQGKTAALATKNDYYMALAYTVRDRMLHRWISTTSLYTREGSRTVAYLSAEFLMGPHLGNNLVNLGIYNEVRQVVGELGLDFDELLALEEEPGLGSGGLGRLAACFLDSMATLEIPSLGYGIRYEFGIFQQEITDGWQVEKTDKWLRFGNPWEVVRPEWAVEVKLGGYTERYTDEHGRTRVRWIPHKIVNGVPYDTPILGYRVNTANTLRLWRAEAPESFDFAVFNRGDYYGAVNQKIVSENLSKILYPNDEAIQGKELRLEQQYFFVCCSLQDMLRILRVMLQARSQSSAISSTSSRISSATAIDGWVSLSCTANFSWKRSGGIFCTRLMRSMSCSEQATKKYCCSRRSSLPLTCSSFGYSTLVMFSEVTFWFTAPQ
jgi:starch phosphorylase